MRACTYQLMDRVQGNVKINNIVYKVGLFITNIMNGRFLMIKQKTFL